MNTTLKFTLLLAASLFATTNLSFGQSPERIQEKIVELQTNGDFEKAGKLYSKLIELFPDSSDLYVQKAQSLCMAGKTSEAFEVYDQAFKMDPKNPLLFLSRGCCFLDHEYYDKGVQDFTDGIALTDVDSILASFYINRASGRIAYMDVAGALEDNLKVLEYDSNNIAMHNNIGMTYGKMKEFDKAELHLKKVLELDSSFPGGFMNLGFLYSEMGNFEKALEALDLAIKKFPDQPFPYNNRGLVKHRLGNSDGAISDIQKSLKMYPDNSYAFRNLAIIYNDLGKTEKSCENCKRAIDMGFTTNYGNEMRTFYTDHCTK